MKLPRAKKGSIRSVPVRWKKRFGQTCLVIAVVLNAVSLLANLRLNGLESEYREKWEIEQYFIINAKSIHAEIANASLLNGNLRTLKTLRKLAQGELSAEDRQRFAEEERKLEHEVSAYLRRAVVSKYLLTHNPSMDADLDKMFAGLSDAELAALAPVYEDSAYVRIRGVKDRMIDLLDAIPAWRNAYSLFLILSTSLVITGSSFLFAAGQGPDIPS